MRIGFGELVQASAVGIGATITMDAVAEVLRRTRGVRSLDYAMVGRWIGHMRNGKFAHTSIMHAEPVPHEKEIGWVAHYAIGTGFAVAWGVGTVAAPWLIMQPGFGMGVAASKIPNPAQARMGSLRAHASYGAGLWLSGRIVRTIVRRCL